MKNIEIITTQNVVLQYELAPLKSRILACILDLIVMTIALTILAGVLAALFAGSETGSNIIVLLLICIFSFYSLAFEFFNKGRSPGKMIMKIQVIKLTGGSATFSDLAARWTFRLIDIYFSLGGLAMILIMSSAKAQRFGDIIANTVVVNTMPKVDLGLEDILAIHRTNKYTPKYLQAKKLQEQDALLIKNTLERYRRYRNNSHDEAISLLCQQVQQSLGIERIEEKQHVFLQTILHDFVLLSR